MICLLDVSLEIDVKELEIRLIPMFLAGQAKSSSSEVKKRLTAIEKIEQSEPYRFFLSTVHGISDSANQTNAISLKGSFIYSNY